MTHLKLLSFIALVIVLFSLSCSGKSDDDNSNNNNNNNNSQAFYMGVDLSYAKQVEDHGGVFKDANTAGDPFTILKNHGANMVRLRLWHNPTWVKDVYNDSNTPLYSGLNDVAAAIQRAKDNHMKVNLDFHYSDFWADPGKQNVPAAWQSITSIDVLCDSVYNYTYNVLSYLAGKGLMPDMVQIGNETNCGMLLDQANASFPKLSVCSDYWANQGLVLNSGIQAVKNIDYERNDTTLIALHVADPKNLDWWFGNIISQGGVTKFDIIGFSYYPIWHTTVSLAELPTLVSSLKTKYKKKVMVLETAYPWTTQGNDSYGNIFGSQTPMSGYPFTVAGQGDFLYDLTQAMITAGASGVFYWEPDWITSNMKDSWGTGSAWENCAFFDFNGNLLESANYMSVQYTFPK